MKSDHSDLKLRKSGIHIGEPLYLGASPDGILKDVEGNLSGIIEIKCPYSAVNLSVRKACEKLIATLTTMTPNLKQNMCTIIKCKERWL